MVGDTTSRPALIDLESLFHPEKHIKHYILAKKWWNTGQKAKKHR